jgi:hypothetical protein
MAIALCLAACSGAPPAPKGPDPAKSTVVLDRTSEVASDAAEVEVAVTSLDAEGKPVTDVTVKVELSGTDNSVRYNPPSGVDSMTGRATALVRSTVAEEKTVTVTLSQAGKDVVLDTKPKLTFRPAAIDRLVFLNQPTNVQVGMVMMPAIHVRVVDRWRNVVGSPPMNVRIQLAEGTPGAILSGGAARDTVDGGAVFDMLSVDRAGTAYGLQLRQVGSPGFADDSMRFDVTP